MDDYYALRITPYNDAITIDNIREFITSISNQYVIGHETEKNDHFHIVYKGDKFNSNLLYDFLQTDKRGNTVYSLTLVRDLDKAVQYAVKDGDYIKSDRETWENFVDQMYSISYEKPKSYEVLTKQLNKEFQDGIIDEEELWVKIAAARCDYDLRLNFNQVDELVRSQIYKKHKDLLIVVVKDRKLFY